MGVSAAIGAALFGVGSSIVGARNAEKESKAAMRAQEEKQKSLEEQFYKQSANQDADKTRAREEAKTRQRQAALGASGQQSTILTSPIGLPGNTGSAQAGGETLLGA